jgi:hypothetical protein
MTDLDKMLQVGIQFLTEFGLPTFLVIFLLVSFQRKIDKLICLVDRLTGVIMQLTKMSRRDFDDE